MSAFDFGVEDSSGATMCDRNHRHVLLDQVVSLSVKLVARRRVSERAGLRQKSGDIGELLRSTKGLVCTLAEVDIEEVGLIRVVSAPTKHEQLQVAFGGVVEER